MGSREIDLKVVGDIILSVENYKQMGSYLPQLDVKQIDTLTKYNEKLLKHSADGKWIDASARNAWYGVDLHVINQMWPSTSCGWGGVGGCAMTNSYSVVIENKTLNGACVYWNGRLAYIADIDSIWKGYMKKGLVPGLDEAKKELNLYYYKAR